MADGPTVVQGVSAPAAASGDGTTNGSESNGEEVGGPPVTTSDAKVSLSEAEAALYSGSALFFGGAYDQKVGPLSWEGSGRLCASAGGKRVVVWDLGTPGAPPPVRQNGRAILVRGHHAPVTWLGFEPKEGVEEEEAACLGSASTDGRILLHHIKMADGKGGGGNASVAARAELIDEPIAMSAYGIAARESPMAWAPGGWLFYGTRRGLQLAAVRHTAAVEAVSVD